MNILQINSTVNTGSTGRIAEGIGKQLKTAGHHSIIAYGRYGNPSDSETIRVGSKIDVYLHGIKSLLFDRHCFGSKRATARLVKQFYQIKPDAVGLHNLHGYYLNIEVLCQALKEWNIPVIYTFHDCWPFTGHCTYYDSVGCEKWKDHCHHCPKTSKYPKSIGADNSWFNFRDKKQLFTNLEKLTIVTPSQWLADEVQQSFFNGFPKKVINNGVDLTQFRPRQTENDKDRSIILGIANKWDSRKGLQDFIELRKILDQQFEIILVGLSQKQIKQLPEGIRGIQRTESAAELAEWYSRATVFINPTYQDNLPTTNIEALACGTPVITYNTGGSPEAINEVTGRVVEKGDIQDLFGAIKDLKQYEQGTLSMACRQRAERLFNQKDRYQEYVELYERLVSEY